MTAADLEAKLDAICFGFNALVHEINKAAPDDGAGRPDTDRLLAKLDVAFDAIESALQTGLARTALDSPSAQRERQKERPALNVPEQLPRFVPEKGRLR